MFKYLEAPLSFMPGTKMAFAGLKDPQDRKDVIAYLKKVCKVGAAETRIARSTSTSTLAADATVEAPLQLRLAALAVVGGFVAGAIPFPAGGAARSLRMDRGRRKQPAAQPCKQDECGGGNRQASAACHDVHSWPINELLRATP